MLSLEVMARSWGMYFTYLRSLHANHKLVIRLDTTEPYQKEHENYKTVKISGVLEIMELSWLSESGRRRLETALHERSNSPLTLERLYGTRTSKHNGKSGLTIKVNIVATKSMTVGYLTCKCRFYEVFHL